MPLPRGLARFNRRWTNRFLEPPARLSPGFAVVHHVGRTSGRRYATPVNVFWSDEDLGVIALTYGPDADWIRNVLAGPATLEHRGSTRSITRAEVVGRDRAWPSIGRLARFALRILTVHHFCRVSLSPTDTSR